MASIRIRKTGSGRLGILLLVVAITVGISLATRVALLVASYKYIGPPGNILGIMGIGALYDLVNSLYVCIPLALYLLLVPGRFFNRGWHRTILAFFLFAITGLLLFNAVAEWLFWDEFSTRFNFIAVDYLIYTTEVIGNIRQSYPIGWILFSIVGMAVAIVYSLKKPIAACGHDPFPLRARAGAFGLYATVVVFITVAVNSRYHRFSGNEYANELAGNGLYELFAAYRNNELDYARFYRQVQPDSAALLIRELIKTPEATFTGPGGIERLIANPGEEKKLNIVLVSVESLSADFMGAFGNTEGITPFLDSLSGNSLLFTRLYATGTRTVRGLEALSLSVPPTPGQSIVRRPNNEHLFSLGAVLREKGYESKFIYGGYGYFDNMNSFFASNGYDVVDRTAIDAADIDEENIWGVADENLFELAIKQIDRDALKGPVFAHIMTTSNHRPYTYPEGRIDIPSHTGRNGAVKYTDYAIGKFIREASSKPWFDNTLFVIVADHCASSAGKTELPVEKYHIPMLVYSPRHIRPGKMDRLMSQVDVGPTLLGLLNFSYKSKFYGYDLFKLEPGRERAFISTYQKLGYLKDNQLVVLSPRQQWEQVPVTGAGIVPTPGLHRLLNEAITWYESASFAFEHGNMKNGFVKTTRTVPSPGSDGRPKSRNCCREENEQAQ